MADIDIIKRISGMGPVWYVQTLKMFGDTLHGSIVVAHYNRIKPANVKLVWGLSERYIDEYREFLQCDAKVALPHKLSNDGRVRLMRRVEALPNVQKTIKPPVGIWGWNGTGSIADNIFHNAGIQRLQVERKPILPVGIEDYAWADSKMRSFKLVGKKYGVLEYNSYTLREPPHCSTKSTEWYNEMLSHVQFPIVYTGGPNDAKLAYGKDLRGCSFRQAKVFIMRSKLMIGCGSGLTMVAASAGVNTPIMEVGVGDAISMNGCRYARSMIVSSKDPRKVAIEINRAIDSGITLAPVVAPIDLKTGKPKPTSRKDKRSRQKNKPRQTKKPKQPKKGIPRAQRRYGVRSGRLR